MVKASDFDSDMRGFESFLPCHLKGAPLLEMHPVSTLPATHLLNITLFSYAGTLYFGLIATDALPNLGRLAAYVEDEIAALERAVGL